MHIQPLTKICFPLEMGSLPQNLLCSMIEKHTLLKLQLPLSHLKGGDSLDFLHQSSMVYIGGSIRWGRGRGGGG